MLLLLHGASVLSTAYDRRSIFSVKQISIKNVSGKNCSKVGIILEVKNDVVVQTWMAKRCMADYTVANCWLLDLVVCVDMLDD